MVVGLSNPFSSTSPSMSCNLQCFIYWLDGIIFTNLHTFQATVTRIRIINARMFVKKNINFAYYFLRAVSNTFPTVLTIFFVQMNVVCFYLIVFTHGFVDVFVFGKLGVLSVRYFVVLLPNCLPNFSYAMSFGSQSSTLFPSTSIM